jgi:hypothetical protein
MKLCVTLTSKPVALPNPCPITNHFMRRGGRFAAAPPPAEGGAA